MAEFAHSVLRTARESRKMPRWELATNLGYSEDVVRRWETGEQRPDPDIVGNIERILKCPGLWHKWMMSTYDSYRERHGEIPGVAHFMDEIVRVRHEILDVVPMFDAVERDALDGKIDNPELWKKFKRELLEAMAAIQQMLDRMPDGY